MLCFILHARLRVHLASGIPCALFYRAYAKFLQKLGRVASRDRGGASASLVMPSECGASSSRGLSAQSPASLGYWVARSSRAMTAGVLGCLKICINTLGVVPANAGTHNHSHSLSGKVVEQGGSNARPQRMGSRFRGDAESRERGMDKGDLRAIVRNPKAPPAVDPGGSGDVRSGRNPRRYGPLKRSKAAALRINSAKHPGKPVLM
jgi:hypothetical protein